MKLVRMLSMAGFVLLGATWAQADTVPGHFDVNLDNPGTPDVGGWLDSQGNPSSFQTTVYSTYLSRNFLSGFQQNSFNCQSEDSEWESGWNWWGWNSWDFSNFRDSNNGCDNDPYILVTQGQHSNGIPSSFSANGTGGGTLDFLNDTGSPITAILLTVSNFQPGMYYCDYVPGLAYEFDHCGFGTDRNGDLEILFWDNPGDSVPSVPEPTLAILLLIALSGMAAGRWIRSRRATAA
ncbi:MAG TPA: hypothetical protein VMH80_05010 [Bryobacteraceae bacterium]|nr:hypothetical protein [Bryobacteraceae bacterium]